MEKARPLLIVVIAMAVLIFIVTTVVVVKLIKDFVTSPAPVTMTAATLRQPLGSHIVTITTVGSRLAVLLSGGGPDRVLLVDPDNGRVAGQLLLSQ
jgi:hypothetical protein